MKIQNRSKIFFCAHCKHIFLSEGDLDFHVASEHNVTSLQERHTATNDNHTQHDQDSINPDYFKGRSEIELHDKGSMVSDLVTRMVNSIPKISRQRKYTDFLVGEINSLPPAVPEWQPSLDVVESIRDEIDRERAMVPIPSPPAPTGRYRFLRIADQTLSRPTIPRSLFGLSIRNNERGE